MTEGAEAGKLSLRARWLIYVASLALAFLLWVFVLADLSFARPYLLLFFEGIHASREEARASVPVAIVNFALSTGPCNAAASATHRTSFACVADLVRTANAAQARAIVVDLYIPAPSRAIPTLPPPEAALAEALVGSKMPIVILVQGSNAGDGINVPLELVPTIYDSLRGPKLYRAVPTFHSDSRGASRYAEGYITANGAFMASVPFEVHALLDPRAKPRRVLHGGEGMLRATTLPIADEPVPATLGEDPTARILEVAPEQAGNAALHGRVWLIGNAYRQAGSDDRDLHRDNEGAAVGGIVQMARAISDSAIMDESAITSLPRWRLWTLGLAVVILLIFGLRKLVELPMLFEFVLGMVATFVFSTIMVAVLGSKILFLPGVAPWQANDLIIDSLYLAAFAVVIAESFLWLRKRWLARQKEPASAPPA